MFLKEGGGSAAPFLQRILPSPGIPPIGNKETPAGGGPQGCFARGGVGAMVAGIPAPRTRGLQH
jgi:hypothetical protein